MDKSDYIRLRDRFTPENPTVIFILESPPASGLYFYNPDGKTTEPLFKAMMKDVLGKFPSTKEEGLQDFAAKGYLIIDATYTPVNNLGDPEADAIIVRDFLQLLEELRAHAQPSTKIVLVKTNICRLLEKRLDEEGFRVLNGGVTIPFPSTGQQSKFREKIQRVLWDT
ncbi:MAG: hypothetical protein ROO76_07215 [Terriglobia bacterium]|nr:hypothetical protein [Terriglobia bacterium]